MAKTTRIKTTFNNIKQLLPLLLGVVFLIYASVLGLYTYRNYVQQQTQRLLTEHGEVLAQYNVYYDQFTQSKKTFLSSNASSLLQNDTYLNDFDSLNQREADLSDQALMLSTALSKYDPIYISLVVEDKRRSDIYRVYTSLVEDSYVYQDYQTLENKVYTCFGGIKLSTGNNRLTSNIATCSGYQEEIVLTIVTVGKANLTNTYDYWNNYFDYWSYVNIVYTSKDKNQILKLEKTINDKYKALQAKKALSDRELQFNFRGKYLELIASF